MPNNFKNGLALKLFLLFSCVGFFSTNCLADNSSQSNQQSETQISIIDEINTYIEHLLETERYQQALDILLTFKPYDSQTLFLLGLASNGLKQYADAADYFQKVVNAEPSQVRPQIELAQAQALAGQTQNAQNTIKAIPTEGLPAELQNGLEQFAQALQQQLNNTAIGKERKNWSLIVSSSLEYDTNINTAPNSDTVTLFNAPFTLSDDAKANKDFGLKSNVNFSHTHKLDDHRSVQSGFSLDYLNYKKSNISDSLKVTGSLGVVTKLNTKTLLSVPMSINQSSYNKDKWYSRTLSVTPQLRHQLDDTRGVGINVSVGKTEYRTSSSNDSTDWSLTPQLIWQLQKNTVMTFSLGYGEKDSETTTSSNDFLVISSSYLNHFTDNSKFSLSTSINSINYNGIEAAFSTVRKDVKTQISASYIKPLTAKGLNLVVSASITKNVSEHDLYDYQKETVGIGLQQTF